MIDVERIDTDVAIFSLLEAGISERNEEYAGLILEITRLRTIKAILEGELGEAVFVPGGASGR